MIVLYVYPSVSLYKVYTLVLNVHQKLQITCIVHLQLAGRDRSLRKVTHSTAIFICLYSPFLSSCIFHIIVCNKEYLSIYLSCHFNTFKHIEVS